MSSRAADILIRVRADETVAVAHVAGEPVEYRAERSDAPSRLGALYAGRVRRVVPALDAAFVDLGEAEDGFLPLAKTKKAPKKIQEGELLAVEVVRDAEGGKGPRLARRADVHGGAETEAATGAAPRLLRPAPMLAIRMVRDWPGPIGRIALDDVDTLLALKGFCRDHRPDLMDKIARFSGGYKNLPAVSAGGGDMLEAEGIAERLEELLAPWVALPSGGRINITPTPALIAIDVDSGRDARGASAEDTAARVNAEAAAEIARQLRLRGLAGLIVAGFLPLRRAAHRADILAALKRAAASDPCALTVGGFTRFGLVEMIRARRPNSKDETQP